MRNLDDELVAHRLPQKTCCGKGVTSGDDPRHRRQRRIKWIAQEAGTPEALTLRKATLLATWMKSEPARAGDEKSGALKTSALLDVDARAVNDVSPTPALIQRVSSFHAA